MEERVRYELVYTGRVQGVGFRYWVHSQAVKNRLTGWARNEYNGSVTVQIQGLRSQIERFEYDVQNGYKYMRIDHVAKTRIPYDTDERRFEVRY